MKVIVRQTFDQDRALYGLSDALVDSCVFGGSAEGESPLKENSGVTVTNSRFSLRYPLWHAKDFKAINVKLDEKADAGLWYCDNGVIEDSYLHGNKALRESSNIRIKGCSILSEEFGWKCENIRIEDSKVESVYALFLSKNLHFNMANLKQKYSLQYVEGAEIRNSYLDSEDALWHSKDVTVKDSVIKGKRLGWFAENLTLINCKIVGSQPLCYCKNLRLIDCTMEGCDHSFEYSEVNGNIIGYVESIKNPLSGTIEVDSLGKLIREGSVKETYGEVIVKEK